MRFRVGFLEGFEAHSSKGEVLLDGWPRALYLEFRVLVPVFKVCVLSCELSQCVSFKTTLPVHGLADSKPP